jgi:hypothetical protein
LAGEFSWFDGWMLLDRWLDFADLAAGCSRVGGRMLLGKWLDFLVGREIEALGVWCADGGVGRWAMIGAS